MADNFATAGGSIHPGKPIIWPSGKAKTSSETAATTETSSKQPVAQTEANTTSAASLVSAQRSTVARQLTVNDIRTHLLSLQLPDTEANVKLASLMLKFGIELSKENFGRAISLLEGSDKAVNTQEAALVLILKGVDAPKEALRALANQFSENPAMSTQLVSAKESFASLSSAIAANPTLLSPAVLNSVSALIGQFMNMIDDLPKKYKFTSEGMPSIDREDLINDVRSMKSLLEGLQQKAMEKGGASNIEAESFSSSIMSTINKMNGLLDNLVSQALLSQKSGKENLGQENYIYYQVPNSLVKPPSTVDIIIKQEQGKKNTIDPKNTQIVIGLETETLGKMVVSLTIKEKNLKFIFNTEFEGTRQLVEEESKTLKKALNDKDYNVENLMVKLNPSMAMIKPYLLPLLGLEHLFRIDTEA
jgi:hypothetical protein